MTRYPYEEISVRNGAKKFPAFAHAPLPQTTIGKELPFKADRSSGRYIVCAGILGSISMTALYGPEPTVGPDPADFPGSWAADTD
jgi:hypothetical protein